MGDPYRLLYDGDCRICGAFARGVRAADLRGRVRTRTIQESLDLLGHVPSDEILDAMHVVDPWGRVTSGGDALLTLAEALVAGPPLSEVLRRSRVVRASSAAGYAVLAEMRGHLICRAGPSAASGTSCPP